MLARAFTWRFILEIHAPEVLLLSHLIIDYLVCIMMTITLAPPFFVFQVSYTTKAESPVYPANVIG